MPGAEKVALVAATVSLSNVTLPGPETLDHLTVKAPGGTGRPSSDALPLRKNWVTGFTMSPSGPAETTGAMLSAGSEWTVTVAKSTEVFEPVSGPSSAKSWRT